jgi:hypothetical protein
MPAALLPGSAFKIKSATEEDYAFYNSHLATCWWLFLWFWGGARVMISVEIKEIAGKGSF